MYKRQVKESGEDVVSQPEIDIVQLEKGKPFIFTAEVAVKPEVTLGDYKGVEVPKAEAEVTEEEVAAELKKEQDKKIILIKIKKRRRYRPAFFFI